MNSWNKKQSEINGDRESKVIDIESEYVKNFE